MVVAKGGRSVSDLTCVEISRLMMCGPTTLTTQGEMEDVAPVYSAARGPTPRLQDF